MTQPISDIDYVLSLIPRDQVDLRSWLARISSVGSLYLNCCRGAWLVTVLRALEFDAEVLERAEIACQLALDGAAQRAAALAELDGREHKPTPLADSAEAVRAVVGLRAFDAAVRRHRAAAEREATRVTGASGVRKLELLN